MTKAVNEQTMRVSTMVPKDWIIPCLMGCLTSAVPAMLAMEPRPASLEKTPRLRPIIMTAPSAPPPTDWIPKAFLKIISTAWTTPSMFMTMTTMQKTNQRRAMTGTTLVENWAILLTPPKMMTAAAMAMIAPKISMLFSNSNAPARAAAELVAWTPTNPIPKVTMIRSARSTASGRLPTPLRA